MSNGEPRPSCPASGLFLIGRNSCGNWVVQDPGGLRGGFFIDRAHALKYAMSENGNRPQALVMAPGVLELDLSARPVDETSLDDAPFANDGPASTVRLRAGGSAQDQEAR